MRWLRSLPIVLALVAASCHASYPAAPDPTIVAVQVFYSYAISHLDVRSSYSFYAYAIRSDGACVDVTAAATWSSSDSQVMTPQLTPGSFRTVGAGRADVSARYQSLVGTLSIPVTDRLTYPLLSVQGGDPRTVGSRDYVSLLLYDSVNSRGQSVTDLATWTSADPSIARVAGGVVTGVRAGTTSIRATYRDLSIEYGLSVQPRR